ncbi:MAG: sulfurtransferase TusA family protein [Anaerofustis sp.]
MIELNCLSDYCPIPLMKLQGIEQSVKDGEQIRLITDHSCVCESITDYCKRKHYHANIVEPMNGIWEIEISK